MNRWICNFAMGDVPTALKSGCIWMNKFDLNVDAQAIVCVREYLLRQINIKFIVKTTLMLSLIQLELGNLGNFNANSRRKYARFCEDATKS